MKTLRMMMVVTAVMLCVLNSPLLAAAGKVKVFILAGQSNMEGKAKNELLDHQATDAKTKEWILFCIQVVPGHPPRGNVV